MNEIALFVLGFVVTLTIVCAAEILMQAVSRK